MVLQNKKKFYLIGTNACDVGDCTLQAIEKINHAKVVVLSKKFDSKFFELLENKKIIVMKKKKIYGFFSVIFLFIRLYDITKRKKILSNWDKCE